MGFGIAKYGNDTSTFKKRNTWGLKESQTENVYRIFPSMHSLAESGKWAQYVIVHWGFSGVDANDPTKTRMRPWNCVEVTDRNRNVVTACPQNVEYAARQAEHDAAEANLKAAGKTKDEIESALGPLKGYLKAFAPDKKYYLCVMNQAGEFGHLKIGYKAKKLLDAKIDELREKKKIDPLALDQGVWFNFKRSGKGRETQDVVDVITTEVEINVNGETVTVDQIKKAPISDDVAEKALDGCEDLVNAGGFKITVEQAQMLVDCDGDPESVDRIMGITQKATPVTKPSTPVQTKTAKPVVKSEAAVVAEKVVEATVTETPQQEVKATENPTVASTISNEAFINKFKKKTKAA